jgi:hypothetical protein
MNTLVKEYVEDIEYGHEVKHPDEIHTHCRLTLKNGYELIGTSVCYDPVGYDPELGKFYAFEDCLRSLSVIHGYMKQEQELLNRESKSGEEEDTL